MYRTNRSSRPPNFVFIVADQWRGDVLGHAGNAAAHTPNLDRLVATEAVSFTNAFCQNPVCTPSRCSFMTGWYPQTRGHRSMGFPLQPDEPNLLQQLRRAGYFVWWGGKNDLVTDPQGFAASCDYRHVAEVKHSNLHVDQFWRGEAGEKPDYSFQAGCLNKPSEEEIYLDSDWSHVLAAEEFLRDPSTDQPFCLILNLQYPHPPYGVEEPYFSAIDRSKLPPRIKAEDVTGSKPRMHTELRRELDLAGHPEEWWDELRATYYGMCARVDDQIGRVLQALRDGGNYDDTAFFFFSDHGDFTGDYDLVEKAQNLFEDCIVHVPFVLKPPVSEGNHSGLRHGLVELVDFPATVYDLAGIQPDYTHFGRSLLPLLARDGAHRDAVFTYGGRREQESHCAVEAGNGHQDPEFLYHPRLRIQYEDHIAHGKALMCRDARFKLVNRLYERDEFYDLQNDPGETDNRIDDPQWAGERDRLYRRIQHFLLDTCDVVPMKSFPRDVSPDYDEKKKSRRPRSLEREVTSPAIGAV